MKTICLQHDEKLFDTVIKALREVSPTARYFRINKQSPPLAELVDRLLEFMKNSPQLSKENAATLILPEEKKVSLQWERKLDELKILYKENAESVDLQTLCFHLGELSMLLHWLNAGKPQNKSFLIRLFD